MGRVAGEEAARYIHLGATTQDILDTALVLQMRGACGLLRRDLLALTRTLVERALHYRGTPMAGRTHLQQAAPITFGLIMAEAVATALTPVLGRAATEEAVAAVCNRAIAENRTLRETLRNDPILRPHLPDAALDQLLEPTSYLGSAGIFVDRVVARIAALDAH